MMLNFFRRIRDRQAAVRARFRADEAGAVALIFAILMVPILMGIAAAVDYSRAVNTRTRLTAAADAAALAGANAASQPSVPVGHRASVGNAAAANYFAGNADSGSYTNLTHTETLTTDASGAVAQKVCYTAKVNSIFGGVGGMSAFDVANCVTARAAYSPYVEFHILIDVSESMTIGATPAAQAIVRAQSGENCAFACHHQGRSGPARAAGATLRLDMVKSAVASVLNSIPASPNVKYQIYRFSNEAAIVSPKTDSAATRTSRLNSLNFDTWNNGGGGSNVQPALNYVKARISPGDGSNPANPITYVMLVTDGIENSAHLSGGSFPILQWYEDPDMSRISPYQVISIGGYSDQTIQSMSASYCTQIKNAGAKMVTMLTPYYVMSGATNSQDVLRDNFVNNTARPRAVTQMQACASSPSMYGLADSSTNLQNAMKTIITVATKPLALSN